MSKGDWAWNKVVRAGLNILSLTAEMMKDGWQYKVLEKSPPNSVKTSSGNTV